MTLWREKAAFLGMLTTTRQRSYARKTAFFLLLIFRGDSFSFTRVRIAG